MSELSGLEIQPRVRTEIGYIDLDGNLMAESRTELERLLREWNEGQLRYVIVNCKELRCIDSAGLSTLIGAQHRLRRMGGDLVLAELNPAMESLFELSSMEKYFEIFGSTAAASKFLREQRTRRKKKGESVPAPKPAGKPKPRARVGNRRAKS